MYACAVPDAKSVRAMVERLSMSSPPIDLDKFASDAHCTLTYSPDAGVDLASLFVGEWDMDLNADVGSVTWWPGHNDSGYVVFKLDSPSLDRVARQFKRAGAKPTFWPYQAHITVASKVGPKTPELSEWLSGVRRSLRRSPLHVIFDKLRVEDIKKD